MRRSLKGGCRWLNRIRFTTGSASSFSTASARLRRSSVCSSGVGSSYQSISPACSAAAAVAGSGITIHSTRSTITRLPPASQEAGSLRGW